MSIRFFKMHGAGNDFVLLDDRTQALPPLRPEWVTQLCNRNLGVGCDQLVVLRASTHPEADLDVAFYNADGSEAGACGNASRCVAFYETQRRGGGATQVVLHTQAGLLPAQAHADGQVSVDMGPPRFDWTQVPLASAYDTRSLPLPYGPAACSMGNPHATLVFTEGAALPDPSVLGPMLEHDPIFPERANIGFAQMLAPDRMRLRVWERGAGLTLACGSGACAAVVNAVRQGACVRECVVDVDGGRLQIVWREDDHVLMTGPAAFVFEGVLA